VAKNRVQKFPAMIEPKFDQSHKTFRRD
jgi:hypothetical protein